MIQKDKLDIVKRMIDELPENNAAAYSYAISREKPIKTLP